MRVELRPIARSDLARIYDFNLQRDLAWAEKVERRLKDRIASLSTFWNRGRRITGKGVRRLSVTDIHYVIDYEPTADRILVLRIRHAREIR